MRDRALIGVMVYSFARVGAVIRMNQEDFLQNGRRCSFRLHEKGGKFHEVVAHHKAADDFELAVARATPAIFEIDKHGVS